MAKNQTIQHKRSASAGNKPTTAQVAVGELAINFADKSIYTRDASNNIIELEREVTKSSTQPASPLLGDIWFDTVNSVYKNFNGVDWVRIDYSGLPALPANTTSSVPLTGSGTLATPYALTVSYTTGSTQLVTTITVTGLAAGQLVPITDTNAATNGARFYVTNNLADDAGVLKFNIMFTDSPATTGSANYTANFVIGTATVYLALQADKASTFPQSINMPTSTASSSSTWSAAADTITATGSLLISTDNSTFSAGPLAVATGATLYVKWSGTAGSGTGIDGAHGSTVTGGLTSSNGATSSGSITIDKTPAAISFTSQTGVGLGAAVTSDTVTISGVNSYIYLTSSNTITASIAGGTFDAVPSSGTTRSIVNGQTLAIRQTSSATSITPTRVTVTAGGKNVTFTVTTTAVGTVDTPSIVTPTNGATGISKTVTITSSAFATTGPAGTHLSSDWEIATNSTFTPVLISLPASTTSLTSWSPSGLSASTLYYVRVRYNSTTSVTSSYNASTSFTTAAQLGVSWTNRNTQTGLQSTTWGTSQAVRKIIWSGTKFLASGGVGTQYAAISTDGITWTNVPALGVATGAGASIAMAWNGSIFCVIGSAAKCATSSDGINWTAGNTSLATAVSNNTPTSLVWTGTKFLSVGGFDTVATSTDGINWTNGGSNLATVWGTNSARDVAWSGTTFCVVGFSGKVATSSDGVNWTNQTGLSSGTWGSADVIMKVIWASGKFLVGGANGKIASSPDGATWTYHAGLSSTSWGAFTTVLDLIWDGTQFCAVGGNGAFATSPDGATWTYQTGLVVAMTANNLTRAVATDGTKLVVGGDATTFGTSP